MPGTNESTVLNKNEAIKENKDKKQQEDNESAFVEETPPGVNEPPRNNNNNHKTTLKKRRKHKQKHKLLRPNSPAAYPLPLPIRNEYFDDETKMKKKRDEREQTTGLSSKEDDDEDEIKQHREANDGGSDSRFQSFRIHYLIIHIAIMLADGLQGTHLYVLYEGYGYTVASLYSLGFLSGAITSPFIGPLVDKVGRRNSAVAYCALEIAINMLEQYDNLMGLIFSRVVGGITTNLLFTVFESWLVTEHRKRGFPEEKLETILRDSVVASNLSAIASGCIAHYCALLYGPTGPFSGAVTCTFVALVLVATRWEENYGSDIPEMKGITCYMREAFNLIISDSKISRIGIIQGLTEGALQTFVFLWSPALRHFALKIPASHLANGVLGIDAKGEPAYGLIFGAFMACGALGGLIEPPVRRVFCSLIQEPPKQNTSSSCSSSLQDKKGKIVVCTKKVDNDGKNKVPITEDGCVSESSELTNTDDDYNNQDLIKSSRNESKHMDSIKESESESNNTAGDESDSENAEEKPMAVELLASFCFLTCAGLLFTPVIVDENNPYAFTLSLISFLLYELVVGLYMPCEGVLRTIYMPNDSICSLMTMLRVIVNVAVALGVISSNYMPFATAFGWCSFALLVAACIQLSLVQKSEWIMLFRTVQNFFKPSSKSQKSVNDLPPPQSSLTAAISHDRKNQ